MALMRYEPFTLMDRLQQEFLRSALRGLAPFEANGGESSVATADWHPAVDIREEQDRYVITADVPGVEAKDIDITLENGVLTLRGERRDERTEEHKDYRRMERVHGTFYRRFSLPDTADAERVEARTRDGVLEVVLPKHEKVQPRRIAVNG